jgi:hypothetical protein
MAAFGLTGQPKSFSSDICNNTIALTLPFNYRDYVKIHRKIAPYSSRIIARTLVEADRRLERHRRFVRRMENAKALSIQRIKDLPRNATIRKEYVKCGRNSCEKPHGPYYYAYWKERVSSSDNTSATIWKLKKKYIGSYLPKTGLGDKGSR